MTTSSPALAVIRPNAMRRPSGEMAGEKSPWPEVSRVFPDPSAFITQMRPEAENAMALPSAVAVATSAPLSKFVSCRLPVPSDRIVKT
jgi:hypothetical protein